MSYSSNISISARHASDLCGVICLAPSLWGTAPSSSSISCSTKLQQPISAFCFENTSAFRSKTSRSISKSPSLTQERHKNIYVTFARKYILTENKARFQDDWPTSKQSSTCFSPSLPKPVLTSGRQKRYCSPASSRALKVTCLHAKLVSSWLGLSIPRPRGHS